MSTGLHGAIEAGGTKFLCALGRSPDELVEETRIATTTPDETVAAVLAFFAAAQSRHGVARSFGVATFGPIDLDRRSPTWGRILDTPKAGWSGADLAGPLLRQFRCEVEIDTDVNAAALAEHRWGAGRGLASLTYITVGTGVGGGAVVDGATVKGFLHPEMGHVRVFRDQRDLEFAGVCPFHGDCLEGLASGPAIRARWGARLADLGPLAHEIIGGYLGQLAANIALTLSTHRIVFGGGVLEDGALLPSIRASAARLLNGYLPIQRAASSIEEYIVSPGLGARSGISGAFLLAMREVLD